MSLQEAVAEAKETANKVAEEGIDQAALDAAAAKGFGNALFEYDEDEMTEVVEEFYPAAPVERSTDSSVVASKFRKNLESQHSVAG